MITKIALDRAKASGKNEVMNQTQRLGTIIQLIGNNPGITLTKLHALLTAQAISVTERTVAKDILLLKQAYELLPDRERLRGGYYLQGIYSLAETEVALVLDAMHVFGVHLNDPEARVAIIKRRLYIKSHIMRG